MGLPEVADYAHNFAVMVRVQGPDPKGLKMNRHAFHHYNSGNTTISASGMLFPESFKVSPTVKNFNGDNKTARLIVTVASVIEPFLSLQHREKLSQDKPELIHGAQVEIMIEGNNRFEHDSNEKHHCWISAQVLSLVDVPASSVVVESLIQASSGSERSWEVGWSLAKYNDGSQPFVEGHRDILAAELSNSSYLASSTMRLALLIVPHYSFKALPNLKMSPSYKQGDLILTVGSPFGILSPTHFFNSVSMGSIANCYPSDSVKSSLLMADIRCLPGMEGSPVFGGEAQLIGMLTRPLRQKSNGAEIQLVIPWEAIATACSDLLLQEEPEKAYNGSSFDDGHLKNCLPEEESSSVIKKAVTSVCLLTIDDGVWASGILLNKQGLILTNAHFLEPWRFQRSTVQSDTNEDILFTSSSNNQPLRKDFSAGKKPIGRRFGLNMMSYRRNIRVRLDHEDPSIWFDARMVYVSKGPLDVALLQLEFVPDRLNPIVVDFTCPSPGSKVFVVGHGLFGPRCDSLPSVGVGVVAKVVEAKRTLTSQTGLQVNKRESFPAMLETTAAVHPGGSGGAVLNSDGHMIGLVTSNARHGGGTVIPHLNFSIPCAALELIFKFSKAATDMQDMSLLEEMDRADEHLSSVWALVPPSPKPKTTLQGDIGQDGKGSRFAKFIADTKEGQAGKLGQFAKLARISTEFAPSKL
ncbi:glyoxysomal processing protease, glyoxysomal isoform X2 [Impatiens glandulifera]|uniref:glyoxysomal processing protease, glyoxysomal isoform X2 n=1 Tax=Impatiens glandulifera TaxID=253017 RepID=UPI001FB0746D|nr:glyoxysomal processing protease, glyoxysomal isoform X2 [Impatiens glandulifera]